MHSAFHRKPSENKNVLTVIHVMMGPSPVHKRTPPSLRGLNKPAPQPTYWRTQSREYSAKDRSRGRLLCKRLRRGDGIGGGRSHGSSYDITQPPKVRECLAEDVSLNIEKGTTKGIHFTWYRSRVRSCVPIISVYACCTLMGAPWDAESQPRSSSWLSRDALQQKRAPFSTRYSASSGKSSRLFWAFMETLDGRCTE